MSWKRMTFHRSRNTKTFTLIRALNRIDTSWSCVRWLRRSVFSPSPLGSTCRFYRAAWPRWAPRWAKTFPTYSRPWFQVGCRRNISDLCHDVRLFSFDQASFKHRTIAHLLNLSSSYQDGKLVSSSMMPLSLGSVWHSRSRRFKTNCLAAAKWRRILLTILMHLIFFTLFSLG